jgi:hypothetical protein
LDQNGAPINYQFVPIVQWEIYSTSIIEEPNIADLYFYLESQSPLALTSLLLLEFDNQRLCQAAMGSLRIGINEC